MKERVMFGSAAVALFIPVLWIGGIPFQMLIGVLAMLGVAEIFKMKQLEIFSIEGILTMLATFVLAVPMEQYFRFLPVDASTVTYTLLVFGLLVGTVINSDRYHFEDVLFPVTTSFYIGIGFQNLINARLSGLDKVLLALFIVWATDIGAYFVGKTYGKRRLLPKVSPNKTLEGSLGGVAFAAVVSIIFMLIRPSVYAPYNFFTMLILVVALSVFGQLGDLVESALKRHFGVKDSGKFIPGHGGVLDRFDSMIFVFPIMHFLGLF